MSPLARLTLVTVAPSHIRQIRLPVAHKRNQHNHATQSGAVCWPQRQMRMIRYAHGGQWEFSLYNFFIVLVGDLSSRSSHNVLYMVCNEDSHCATYSLFLSVIHIQQELTHCPIHGNLHCPLAPGHHPAAAAAVVMSVDHLSGNAAALAAIKSPAAELQRAVPEIRMAITLLHLHCPRPMPAQS